MPKKRTTRKKSSPAGKDRRESDILRAKQAISAALTDKTPVPPVQSGEPPRRPSSAKNPPPPLSDPLPDKPVPSSAPRTAPGVFRGLLRAAAGLVSRDARQQTTGLPARNNLPPGTNPLAGLARAHANRPLQARTDLAPQIDRHCARVMTELAKARIQASPPSEARASTTADSPYSD